MGQHRVVLQHVGWQEGEQQHELVIVSQVERGLLFRDGNGSALQQGQETRPGIRVCPCQLYDRTSQDFLICKWNCELTLDSQQLSWEQVDLQQIHGKLPKEEEFLKDYELLNDIKGNLEQENFQIQGILSWKPTQNLHPLTPWLTPVVALSALTRAVARRPAATPAAARPPAAGLPAAAPAAVCPAAAAPVAARPPAATPLAVVPAAVGPAAAGLTVASLAAAAPPAARPPAVEQLAAAPAAITKEGIKGKLGINISKLENPSSWTSTENLRPLTPWSTPVVAPSALTRAVARRPAATPAAATPPAAGPPAAAPAVARPPAAAQPALVLLQLSILARTP
ncbi:hypothetical protein GH733_014254, partial [Mirounga leonina]